MKAHCLIRTSPHYRHESFLAGLKRAGYQVTDAQPSGRATPGDVLILWNRYGHHEQIAQTFTQQGGLVLVAENGYLGADADGIQNYALAIDAHNGAGRWPIGDDSRWRKLDIELKSWRSNQEGHTFIRGQRGFGSHNMASPPQWHQLAGERIKKLTGRAAVVQDHPGKHATHPGVVSQLMADLQGAFAVAIWCSGVGVKALAEGYPVFYDAPHWICETGGTKGIENINAPLMDDRARLNAMIRMSWAQWSVSELSSGEPFVLLREHAAKLKAAA